MSPRLNASLLRKTDQPLPSQYSSLRALVVDDEDYLLELVCRMLSFLGIGADAADGGPAAMRCLEQNTYDLLITDYQMPEVDGYTLAGWLKQQSRHTKIIVMTGRSPADMKTCMNGGIVDDWLFKPFTMSMLAVMLDRHFNPDGLPQ